MAKIHLNSFIENHGQLRPKTFGWHRREPAVTLTEAVTGLIASRPERERSPAFTLPFAPGCFDCIALFATLYVLFRSQRAIASLSVDEERRIRALLAQHGGHDSLGYFATRRDKAVVFSPSGKAAVTYRVVNGVALASGDPIGDPEAWGPAIEAFLSMHN